MVWIEIFGFCYTISIRYSQRYLLVILLLLCVMGILKLEISRIFHTSQTLADNVYFGVGPGTGPQWPSLVGQPVGSPYPYHQRELFRNAPTRPPNATIIKKQALMLEFPWTGSPPSSPPETTPQCCLFKKQRPTLPSAIVRSYRRQGQLISPYYCWWLAKGGERYCPLYSLPE